MSIVFADLIGSTSLHEQLDAESTRHVMERFYQTMREVLEANSGRVEKFIGDAVVAVFGAPSLREDDAVRAVRSAAEMIDALQLLNEELERTRGVRLGMRTGVNTGEVVESRDGYVVGDPVNLAARLEQSAANGEILVGETTWRLARYTFTFEPVAPLELKGKSDPVAAFRLVSLAAPASLAVPFVGREEDLERITSEFEDAIAMRRARLVTVIGSPGLGKTRLANVFARSVADQACVLEARCEPAGVATFAPIADMLRDATKISDEASEDEIFAALSALIPDESDRHRVALRAASLLGAGEIGSPEETFWAVRRIIEALGRERPVVFVLDDLHWAESMLLDLVEHLAEWTRGPLLLLVLARPELRETRHSLAADSSMIVLDGLDEEASSRLAHEMLDARELPVALLAKLLHSSQGNPLYLSELLRMLVDDGVLLRGDNSWKLTVDASELDVPPTISALMSARIERLRSEERIVIERAAIIGKQFYRGAVAHLAPLPIANDVDSHLETLRRKELIEPEGSFWIDEPVFRFHHVLIRDAAYKRLLKEARADLHERFAQWLEHKAGDLVGEHEEVIGYHLEQAHEYQGQLGPLDESGAELGRRAARHLAAAGNRALERDDLPVAADLMGRALRRLAAPDAQLLIARCEALFAMGQVTDATPCLEELSRLAMDSPRLQAWTACFSGQLANLVHPEHLHNSAESVATAAARFTELGDAVGAAKAHHVHAQTLTRLGQIGAAEAALDRALAAAREAGDRRRANAVLSDVPAAALWGPSPVARASGRCLDVVRVLRITSGAPTVEATALRCQAVIEALRGRDEPARRMLDAARSGLEDLGIRHELHETDVFAGIVELLNGNDAAAELKLRPALDGLRVLGLSADAALATALLARVCLAQGKDAEADELTHESERLAGDDLRSSIAWRTVRARVLSRRGETEEAVRFAREAVAIADPTDALIDQGDARRTLAQALSAAGREIEASVEAARAAKLFEQKGAAVAGNRARLVPVETPIKSSSLRLSPNVRASVTTRWWEDLVTRILARNWAALRPMFSPEIVVFDRRTGLRSEAHGEEFVNGFIEFYDSLAAHEIDIEVIASDDRRALLRFRNFATDGTWERTLLHVSAFDGQHRIDRAYLFDDDALDEARARYLEW